MTHGGSAAAKQPQNLFCFPTYIFASPGRVRKPIVHKPSTYFWEGSENLFLTYFGANLIDLGLSGAIPGWEKHKASAHLGIWSLGLVHRVLQK